jgi:hypothetical protein
MRSIFTHESGGKLVVGSYPQPSWILNNSISTCVNLCNLEERMRYGKYEEIVSNETTMDPPPRFVYLPMDMKLSNLDPLMVRAVVLQIVTEIVTGKLCYVHDGLCGDRVNIFAACVLLFCDDHSTSHDTLVRIDGRMKGRPNLKLITTLTKLRHETRENSKL